VELPEFDLSRNEIPEENGEKDKGHTQSSCGRSRAEKSVQERKALKNGKRVNDGKRVNKQKATNGLTAVDKDKKINDKAHKRKANAQTKDESKGQDKDEPPSAPTSAPPSEPQGSDALGGSNVIPFTAPRGSVKPDSGQQPALATAVGNYDRYDGQFGTKVYVALGFPWEIGSPEARREICSFASKGH
jgi:hypothetical protein